MTSNQIRYLEHREQTRHNYEVENETKRSNRANEAETYRSNVAREEETYRHNTAYEGETKRHNQAQEYLDLLGINETSRHNRATEGLQGAQIQLGYANLSELSRSNKAREAETYRSNKAREDEMSKHNRNTERLTYQANVTAQQRADNESKRVTMEQWKLPYEIKNIKSNTKLNNSKRTNTNVNTIRTGVNVFTDVIDSGSGLIRSIGSILSGASSLVKNFAQGGN